jgi:hypothetical protein
MCTYKSGFRFVGGRKGLSSFSVTSLGLAVSLTLSNSSRAELTAVGCTGGCLNIAEPVATPAVVALGEGLDVKLTALIAEPCLRLVTVILKAMALPVVMLPVG